MRRLEGVIDDQRETNRAFGEMARDLALRKAESEDRLRAVMELRIAERYCQMPDKECAAFNESFAGHDAPESAFKERLWELELALEDRGWVRETTLAALEFSRYGVGQLIRICRIYGIKNPIIKRIAEICELYVFGRGIEIRSDDKGTNDVIQDFLQANDAEMGHNGLARKEKELQTDGALYFSLPTQLLTGEVRVIMIDPLEIMEVVTDPDDTAHPLYFKRQWNRAVLDVGSGMQRPEPKMCWYPSLELINSKPTSRPLKLGGIDVNWNMPILRDSAGSSPSKWRWPVPPVYACVDWARAYQHALEDYATVQRTLARFALMIETKGGPGAIAAYSALFSTTFADSNGTTVERNPPPVVGSVHTSGPGTKVEAFKSAGAQANPEQSRRILLMSCAGSGLPECYDDQTEVLTDQGFMLHPQWAPGMKVACFNPATGLIEYQHPKALAVHDYAGEMMAFKNAQTDILVTPNHRMWCAPALADKPYSIVEARDVSRSNGSRGWKFSTKAVPTETNVESIETPLGKQDPVVWAKMLGYWIAEGCATQSICKSGEFRKDGSPIMRTFRRVMFAQQPGPVLDSMRASLRSVDVKFHEVVATAGVVNLVIVRKMLWEHLRAECGQSSYFKRIPRWILTAQEPVRRAIFDALMEGDGGKSGSSLRYSTVSKQLADDVQVLAHSLGMAASISPDDSTYAGAPHRIWRVLIRLEWTKQSVIKAKHIKAVAYAGKVYCFSVPTGIYVTRRNGKLAIQGNTFFGDASTGSLATAVSLDRPTELKMTAIQRRWKHTIKRILEYQILMSRTSIGGRLKEAAKGNPAPKAAKIEVVFPNVIEHLIQPMIQAITEIATCGGRNGISAGIVDRRTIAKLLLTEMGVEHVDKLLDKIYGTDYNPANDVTDQRSQVPPQSLVQPTGKPLDDLSTPPPLPPPPAPPVPVATPPPAPGVGVPAVPAKPGAPARPAKPAAGTSPAKPAAKPKATAAAKKEALAGAIEALRAVAAKD